MPQFRSWSPLQWPKHRAQHIFHVVPIIEIMIELSGNYHIVIQITQLDRSTLTDLYTMWSWVTDQHCNSALRRVPEDAGVWVLHPGDEEGFEDPLDLVMARWAGTP